MNTIILSWEGWRAVIALLRQKALRCLLVQANSLESQPEQHAPAEPMDRLSLTDDVFLRSCTWARWQLGIPLPVDRGLSGQEHPDR